MKTALTVLATVILTAIAILAWEQSGIFSISGGEWSCSATSCPAPGSDGRSCATPWSTTAKHGESILSFAWPTGNTTQPCISKTSACNNGTRLNDEQPLPFATCQLDTPNNCEVNGEMVADGSTKIFYNAGELSNWQRICISQSRNCMDGVVDGDEQFMYGSCENRSDTNNPAPVEPIQPVAQEQPPVVTTTTTPSEEISTENKAFNCPSPRGGVVREPGRTSTVYLQSAVLEGETCESKTVTCAYGAIRYGTQDDIGEEVKVAVYPTCGTRDPLGCTSLCGSVGNGEMITSYPNNSVAYSSSNSCADISIHSVCNDGLLSPEAGSYCACEVAAPKWCTAPGDIQIPHGGSLTLYQSAEVQALPGDGSDTCIRQRRECGDGIWHDFNGTPSEFTFAYPSCTVLPPPAGGGPGGEGVPQ